VPEGGFGGWGAVGSLAELDSVCGSGSELAVWPILRPKGKSSGRRKSEIQGFFAPLRMTTSLEVGMNDNFFGDGDE
jgi:hypothetical protein